MQITFVRHPERRDRIYVVRDDGSETSWEFPSMTLPHDLVHLAVERRFGLRKGFWGRVADGVEVERINAMANRAGGKHKYAGFGEDLSELHLAEALAGAPWNVADLADDDLLAMLRGNIEQAGLPVPALLTEATIAELRETLDELQQRWAAAAPKGALKLEYP